MTVCIGIICEGRRSAVVVADRLVTVPGLGVTFEHQTSKMDNLSDKIIAMASGVPLLLHSVKCIYNETVSALQPASRPKTVMEVSGFVKDSVSVARLRKINDLFFKPLGFDVYRMEDYARNQNGLHPQVLSNLINQMNSFRYELSILIVGVDDTSGGDNYAHIYNIESPGDEHCQDFINYAVIGSGTPLAETTLMLEQIGTGLDINEAIYYALLSKKVAEKAPGVGRDTELRIITQAGIENIEGEQLSALYRAIKPGKLSTVKGLSAVRRLRNGG